MLVGRGEKDLSLQTRCDAYTTTYPRSVPSRPRMKGDGEGIGDIPCIVSRHAARVALAISMLVYGNLSCGEESRGQCNVLGRTEE